MDWTAVFILSVGLAMDAFAVSISAGIRVAPVTGRHVFRLAFHFGLFQFMMPVIGGLLGQELAPWTQSWGRWIAFGLLVWIGGKMIYDVFRGEEGGDRASDPTRGWALIYLSFATSIDALAAGVSFSLVNQSVLVPSLIIGLVAGGFSVVGARFGSYFGEKSGKTAELFGGILLIGLGVKMLIG